MIDNLIYLDTNIYNKLARSMNLAEISDLRRRILQQGKRPILSPINILEILATENEQLRENIIVACQHFCEPELLSEPETLIIGYIASYAPREETAHLIIDDQLSKSDLAHTWREIQTDKERTLLINRDALRRLDLFKTLQGYFHAYYSRGNRLPDLRLPDINKKESIYKCIADVTRDIRQERVANPRMAILCENRILITLTILCAGLSPFPQAIDDYWDAVGIATIEERYSFAKSELSFLQEHGPIIGLGSFMGWQATKGYDSGNFFDCLHFMYLPYVELFYTDDQAFHDFVREYPESRVLDKIVTSDKLL